MNNLKLPPQHLDAERSVLGSLLFLNNAIDEINLRADEFYSDQHQKLFRAIQDMWRSGARAIDGVTLAEELIKRQELDAIGGQAYLAEILDAVPHAAHVRYYANIVREKAQLRSIISACTESIEMAYNGSNEDILDVLDSKLLSIREASSGGEVITIAEAVDALEDREKNPLAIHSTGLIDIDRQIRGGFRAGQLIIVGGRPGSGKSVITGQIARSFAERGEPALIVSLEMDRAEMAERYDKTVDRRTLRELPIHILDSAYEIRHIAGLIRTTKRKHDIQIAVLDYLQLTESEDRKASRERQVAEVSRTMKRLASELKIPVVAACQLNRNNDKEQRPPRLSDLRESGSIEQDADIVVLLHQDENETEAIIAKHRNGSTGVVPLKFRGNMFVFDDHCPDVGKL